MGSFRLEKNALVVLDGIRMRVRKKVRENSKDHWQLEEESTGSIIQKDEEELFLSHYNGNFRFVGGMSAPKGKTAHHQLTDDEKEEIRWRLPFVKAVLNLPVKEASFKDAIDDVWGSFQSRDESAAGSAETRNTTKHRKKRTHPPGWVSVYRWRVRYVRSGNDAYALLNKEWNRSEDLDPDLILIIDDVLEEVYLTRERSHLQEAINTAKQRCKEKNEEKERLGLPLISAPSRRQVQRRLAMIPAFDVYAARFGRDAAMVKFRSVEDHRTTTKFLDRAEIDHTPLDLFVVDDHNGLPLGRPYITACIDDFTRCVLGIYVGFVPPSYESVAHCLTHAFLPKVAQREDYPEVDHPWISYGVMHTLVCDNGVEFHSEALEHACHQLGISPEYAPRKTGWYKAKIERFLRRLNEEVAHGTRGTTFSNIFERDDYNPEKYAVIRLSTLKLGLQIWVCDIYHQKKHYALGMPPETMWKLHAKPDDILIPGDRNFLRIVMGRPYPRELTHKGIEFAGLYYGSEATHDLRIRYGAKLRVEIRVNLENIGEIHVLYGQEVVTARALNFDYANGISLWLHEQIKKYSLKYDPDVWLAGKEKLRRLFKGEREVLRKLSRKGKGRAAAVIDSLELTAPSTTLLLPTASTVAENSAEPFVSNVSNLPKIPSFRVILNNGRQ
jgi:putative transposase